MHELKLRIEAVLNEDTLRRARSRIQTYLYEHDAMRKLLDELRESYDGVKDKL